ncbi:hypothetical protein L3Q82_002439 [Scortum barcoo]|uniref:Uncharacterized protein n=1 Tax=Scortum barcoo TaxID=214431 RepID=A0ACB8VYK6_9TELE|nr:hypothetical protein L3Q82_002439 [Scortum barcoo]
MDLTGLTDDMRQPLLLISLSLAVLLSANVLAQGPVPIQFQADPVLVQTGTEIVFTVQTVPQVFSMTWIYKGDTLGTWIPAGPSVNSVAQFVGRITISATQLRIGNAQLRDAGNYTVEVTPSATTGLTVNSRSIQLRVFDAVNGVSLFVPTVAVEGRNVSLQCTWTAGTEITVQWGKGGVAVTADSRITFSGGFLIINPARRSDTGMYTCTVSNLVSAQTATQSLTVYYGPDTPVLTKDAPKKCVGGGDVLVGQTVRLTCVSDSLPPALFSWQRDGQPVTSGQLDSGVLSLQTFSTNESGRYVCTARNSITGGTSAQGTDLAIVGEGQKVSWEIDLMPWDRLRGTPAYPSGRFQRRGTSPEFTSDYTADYTISPPIPNNRKPNRSQPQPQDQSTSRNRAPLRQDPPSVDRQTRSRSADLRVPNTRRATQLEAAHNTKRSPHTQRESAQRDIRGSPGGQTAPRQETTRSYNPRALPLMSQQISAPQGADTRALADPNHLSQAHMAQQHRATPIQTPPQGLGTQTQPVIHGANQPRQGGTAPVPFSFAQPNPSNLTQAALATHTERAQTFQNRRQQTQAALLHPGPQARAPAAEDQHPPTPPPVIPLAQFQTLPRSRTQATSPVRGAQPPRPPVNIPVAQRPLEIRQRHTLQPRPAARARTQDHAKIRARTHANTQAHNHKNPTHFTQPRQSKQMGFGLRATNKMNLFLRLVVEVQSVCLDHSFISLPIPCSHFRAQSPRGNDERWFISGDKKTTLSHRVCSRPLTQ